MAVSLSAKVPTQLSHIYIYLKFRGLDKLIKLLLKCENQKMRNYIIWSIATGDPRNCSEELEQYIRYKRALAIYKIQT